MRPKYLEVTKNEEARFVSFKYNFLFHSPFFGPGEMGFDFVVVVVFFIFESNEYYCVHKSIFNGFRK